MLNSRCPRPCSRGRASWFCCTRVTRNGSGRHHQTHPGFPTKKLLMSWRSCATAAGCWSFRNTKYDKYGSNLNELLAPLGLQMENSTVIDRAGSPDYPTRIAAEPLEGPLAHGVREARFYQTGSCKAQGAARIAWKASSKAQPPDAGLIGTAQAGEGRVILVSDSSLFGDEHLRDYDHEKLWLNFFYWLAVPAFRRLPVVEVESEARKSDAWARLRSAVNALRLLQNADGSVPGGAQLQTEAHLSTAAYAVDELRSFFPHQELYLAEMVGDLRAWAAGGFGKPDFGRSLARGLHCGIRQPVRRAVSRDGLAEVGSDEQFRNHLLRSGSTAAPEIHRGGGGCHVSATASSTRVFSQLACDHAGHDRTLGLDSRQVPTVSASCRLIHL